jgi:hypothetical protein
MAWPEAATPEESANAPPPRAISIVDKDSTRPRTSFMTPRSQPKKGLVEMAGTETELSNAVKQALAEKYGNRFRTELCGRNSTASERRCLIVYSYRTGKREHALPSFVRRITDWPERLRFSPSSAVVVLDLDQLGQIKQG